MFSFFLGGGSKLPFPQTVLSIEASLKATSFRSEYLGYIKVDYISNGSQILEQTRSSRLVVRLVVYVVFQQKASYPFNQIKISFKSRWLGWLSQDISGVKKYSSM